MIADLLNTLVGLWLAHTAIFPDAAGTGRDRYVLIAAIGTIVLAVWARRSDASPWQSTTTMTVGVLLALLEIAHQLMSVSDMLMFWGILWAGLISATLSLWAALYRPGTVDSSRVIAHESGRSSHT
jgi:hypothetical protein